MKMKMPKMPTSMKKVKTSHAVVGAVVIGTGIWFFFLRKKSSSDSAVINPGDGEPVSPPGNPPEPPYVPGGDDFTMDITSVITPASGLIYVDLYPFMSIDPFKVEALKIVYPYQMPNGLFVYNTFTMPYLTPEMRNPSPGSIPVIDNWFARVIIPSGSWKVTAVARTFGGEESNAVSISVSI